jgi:hypothetical protein
MSRCLGYTILTTYPNLEVSSVFSVRPVAVHFLVWLILAPLAVFEMRALEQLRQTIALQEQLHVGVALADVIDQRLSARGPEVRYEFRVAGRMTSVPAMNTSGWGKAWIPISKEAWDEMLDEGGRIPVRYLPENPEANQPVGRVGSPIGDSMLSWALFLFVDIIWAVELTVVVINYLRCQVAAERREGCRLRFWQTVRQPSAIERYTRSQKSGVRSQNR